MPPQQFIFAGLLASLVAGCSVGQLLSPAGSISGSESGVDGAGDPSATGSVQFVCDAARHAPAVPLRRLSRSQYENVLRDLLNDNVGPELTNAVLTQAAASLARVPSDSTSKHSAFTGMDQSVAQEHVDAQFGVASTVARSLTAASSSLAALLGACSSATAAAGIDKCIDDFIVRFGTRALRKPVSEEDRGFYRSVYAVQGRFDARALADVLTVMLSAPEFLYVVEGAGEQQATPGLFALTPHELAARLALHFWQSTPDAGLLAAAQAGELSSDDGYRAAVERMLRDARSQRTMQTFVREWFALDELRPLDSLVGDPVFDAFVADAVPSPDLRDDMIEELSESLRYHTFEQADDLSAWLTSQLSFARSAELAAIYNVPVWNGQGTPPPFPNGERAGLLTRAALLATGSANTRPIMKGVFIREKLLCDEIAPPPNNAANNPPQLSPEQTTREVVEALTEANGGSCAGCHSTQINGLGFPSESFDALGRVRDKQSLYAADGSLITARDVDTSAVPRVWLSDQRPVRDANELTQRIVESGKVEACFARQYLRFTFGRVDDRSADGCALETVREGLAKGAPLLEVFTAIALSPDFRRRYVPEGT